MLTTEKTWHAWEQAIGPENVITREDTRLLAQTSTYQTTQRIPAVVRPGSREEVQECLRLANRDRLHVYPVSGGKNWGYGSRVPVQDSAVLLDLSRLNRILDYNEKLAYVTVEPGVTQRQLSAFLRAQNSPFFASMTGSTPDSSIVGNTMERGIARGPYGDRFGHVCGLEVVLPTGDCIHTGYGRFPNAQSAKLHRWGVGPYLDGLFTQSNLGVVTQMTVWLLQLPDYFQMLQYKLMEEAQLVPLLDGLQRLALNGLARPAFSLYNDYRAYSFNKPYPWWDAEASAGFNPTRLKQIFREDGIGLWNGDIPFYAGSKELGQLQGRLVAEALRPHVSEVEAVELEKDEIVELVSNPEVVAAAERNGDNRRLLVMNYLGLPTEGGVRAAYWRKKTVPALHDLHPDRDACGLMWHSPAIPFDGPRVAAYAQLVTDVLSAYQFEPSMSLQCTTERSIDSAIAIAYDRAVPGEDDRADACMRELTARLSAAGYFPYRLSVNSMASLPPPLDDYPRFYARLKQALDPHQVLAPGRYH